MMLFKQFLFAAIATLGFAGYFNVKGSKVLIAASISGGISYAIYYVFTYFNREVPGVFVAALLMGVMGEFWSTRLKAPSTIFIMPGIIPLVPGAGMYYTMLDFANEDFTQMIATGAHTFSIAGAIAMGILVGSIFSKSVRRMRRYNFK